MVGPVIYKLGMLATAISIVGVSLSLPWSSTLHAATHPILSQQAGALPGELESLPPWLAALGCALVGQQRASRLVRNAANVTSLRAFGIEVHLTAFRKDDSIPRLKKEFASANHHDKYGLSHITSASPLVLDVGGNIGFITTLINRLHPQSQIVVFEPSPVTYFFLRINLWLNQIHVLTSEELQSRPSVPGVYPVFGGLGGQDPFQLVHVADTDGASKYQSQNVIPMLEKPGTVPVYNWPRFMATHGLASRVFDLVKLDCECCEYQLVPQASGWLSNKLAVKRLAGELHPCGSPFQKPVLQLLRGRNCSFPPEKFKPDGTLKSGATLDLNKYCHAEASLWTRMSAAWHG